MIHLRKRKFIVHDFFCTQCGLKMPLPRVKSMQRKGGHLKSIYCYRCKEKVNFIECNEQTFTSEQFQEYFNSKELEKICEKA